MSYNDSNNVITGFGRMESVNYSDLRVQKTLAVIQAAVFALCAGAGADPARTDGTVTGIDLRHRP